MEDMVAALVTVATDIPHNITAVMDTEVMVADMEVTTPLITNITILLLRHQKFSIITTTIRLMFLHLLATSITSNNTEDIVMGMEDTADMVMAIKEVVMDMLDHTMEHLVMGIKDTKQDIKDTKDKEDTLSLSTLMDKAPKQKLMGMVLQATTVIKVTTMGATTEGMDMDMDMDMDIIIITNAKNLRYTYMSMKTVTQELQQVQQQQLAQQQVRQEQPLIQPKRLFISVAAGDITVVDTVVDIVVDTVAEPVVDTVADIVADIVVVIAVVMDTP